jgi:hypothetical protein
MRVLPNPRSGAHRLLTTLLAGPGTFYQICERADIDIEDDRAECIQRALFNDLVDARHAFLVGVTYAITTPARRALTPAPVAGKVAGPAHRAATLHSPVVIARRAAGAHP